MRGREKLGDPLKRNTCGVYCITLWGIFLPGKIFRYWGNWKGK